MEAARFRSVDGCSGNHGGDSTLVSNVACNDYDANGWNMSQGNDHICDFAIKVSMCVLKYGLNDRDGARIFVDGLQDITLKKILGGINFRNVDEVLGKAINLLSDLSVGMLENSSVAGMNTVTNIDCENVEHHSFDLQRDMEPECFVKSESLLDAVCLSDGNLLGSGEENLDMNLDVSVDANVLFNCDERYFRNFVYKNNAIVFSNYDVLNGISRTLNIRFVKQIVDCKIVWNICSSGLDGVYCVARLDNDVECRDDDFMEYGDDFWADRGRSIFSREGDVRMMVVILSRNYS